MIAEWYFLNCLRFPARRSAPVLAILETLEVSTDPSLISSAIEELAKAELPIQVYAAPRLFRLLRKEEFVDSTATKDAVIDALLNLRRLVDDGLHGPLEMLIRAATSDNEDDILPAANEVAEFALRATHANQNGTPYLDLADRISETLVLEAMLAAVVAGNVNAGAIGKAMVEGSAAIALVCQAAREGKLGRLAFLQSVELTHELENGLPESDRSNESAFTAFVELQTALPLEEPDLIEAAVRCQSFDEDGLATEIVSLRRFRRLRHRLHARPRRDARKMREHVVSRLGLEENPGPVLSILLWQFAAANIMAKQMPRAFGSCAERWWKPPPVEEPDWPLPIKTVGPEKNISSWLECLIALGSIRKFAPQNVAEFEVLPATARVHRLASETVPLLFSPWMDAGDGVVTSKRNRSSRTTDPVVAAKRVRETLGVLRLTVAAWQSLLLLSEKKMAAAPPAHCLEMLVHFEQAVGQPYRGWLDQAARVDQPRPTRGWHLPPEISSLVLFVRQQVLAATRGLRVGGATPAAFTALDRRNRPWIAEVLVRWVEDVFRFEDVAPAARAWTAEFAKFGPDVTWQAKDATQQTAVLLVRALTPELYDPQAIGTAWQEKARNKVAGSDGTPLVRHREIMAAPLGTLEDWAHYPHLLSESAPVPLQISAATERLFVSFPGSEDGERIRNRWIDEFHHAISRVGRPADIDRFAAERLRELVTHRVLAGRDEVRITLIRLLVERAGITVLGKLSRVLLLPPADESCSLAWPQLRVAVMRGMFARGWLKADVGVSSEDPYQVMLRHREAAMFERLGRLFLCGTLPSISAAETDQLRAEFRSLVAEPRHSVATREVRVAVENGQATAGVDVLRDGVELQEWMLTHAVEDVDTSEFTLLLDARIAPRPRDHRDPRLAFIAGPDPVGTLVAVDEFGQWHYDVSRDGISEPVPGTAVCLYPQQKNVVPLDVELTPGAVCLVDITRRTGADAGKLFLGSREANVRSHPISNLDLWDPDWSRAFLTSTESYEVQGKYLGDGEWAPIPRSLSHFLARKGSGGKPQCATLTYMGRRKSRDGEEWWRFGHRPGEIFDFRTADFEAGVIEAIENEIASGTATTGAGLLVSVEIIAINDTAQIRLLRAPWPESIHPQLRCPFDRRNLEWRQSFKAGDSVRANYDAVARGWFIAGDSIPGFPDRVRVRRWWGQPPDAKQQWVIAQLSEWREEDQRRAWISARAAGTELNLTDLSRLYGNLSALQDGTLAELWQVMDEEVGDDAEVACLTDDKLRVMVPLDSLTLAPLAREVPRQVIGRGRKIVLRQMQWEREEAVTVAFEAQSRPALEIGWHTGFVVATPPRNEAEGMCKVLFAEAKAVYAVRIVAPLQALPNPGAKLRIEVKKDGVRNSLMQRLRIFATSAVWKISVTQVPPKGGWFVGECEWNSDRYWAVETEEKPMELHLVVANGVSPRPFARWQSPGWSGGILDTEWRAFNTDTSRHFAFISGRRMFRVCLRPRLAKNSNSVFPVGAMLAGVSFQPTDRGDCRVLRMDLKLDKLKAGEAMVHRIFTLGAFVAPPRARPSLERNLEDHLGELVAVDPVQPCGVNWKAKTCQIEGLQRVGFNEQQSTLRLQRDGGVWVSHAASVFHVRGRVYLEQLDGVWTANFRRVPSLTVQELRDDLGAALGEPQRSPLFFVGPVSGGSEKAATVWRFECGYGKTVDIPEQQLRSRDRPFNLRHLLFHGDRIQEFRFVEIPDPNNGPPTLGLDIDEVAIEPAPGTILYRQAKRYKVVHLLHLSISGAARITSIRGCDERRTVGAEERFYVPHASLDDQSARAVLTEVGSTGVGSGEGAEHTIYGRMRAEIFEASRGQRVEFERVNLTGDSSEKLRDGELLLMLATKVESGTNDEFLQLEDIAEITGDRLSVSVSRRHFSSRESLLRRLAKNNQQFEKEVAGHVFAVRIIVTGDKRVHGRGSLRNNIPDRRLQSLRDHLRFSSEPFFAVVCDRTEKDQDQVVTRLRLEHRPGIFFTISLADVSDERSMRLSDGTIVQLEIATDGQLRLVPCSFGDTEYFRSGSRPVVAFPLNNLLHRNAATDAQQHGDEWWLRRDRHYPGFSVGDFPNTLCLPRTLKKNGVLGAPSWKEMRDFMSKRHPKIALIHFNSEHGPNPPVLTHDAGSHLVGAVAWTEDQTPRPMLHAGTGEQQTLNWMALTFSDSSIQELMKRWRDRSWNYHDEFTGGWRGDSVVTERTPEHNLRTGPLFFEQSASGPRLRYFRKTILSRAIPATDLSEMLGWATQVVSVAGVVRLGGQNGLLVEHLPGRVYHLPGPLFSWRMANSRFSLARLDWSHFAEGDELTIRVNEGAVLAPDYLDIEHWRRGPRVCFGHNRALLPVIAYDDREGALMVGAGKYQIKLPTADRPTAASVWVNSDNDLELFDAAAPGAKWGDCCLLGLDPASGEICLVGHPEIKAVPHRAGEAELVGCWHGWEKEIFLPDRSADGPGINWIRLRQVIGAVGGALPATVEGMSRDNRTLFFSFRNQSNTVASGHRGLAMPIGYLPGWNARGATLREKVLLWVGGGILACDFEHVISGVPTPFRKSCAEALVQRGSWVWLEADNSGRISVGLGTDAGNELMVSPVAVVRHSEKTPTWGLLVRSEIGQKLYWIPASDVGWTPLSAEAAERHFLNRPECALVPARKIVAGNATFLSLVEARAAVRERESLGPSAELRVFVRELVEDGKGSESRTWLAESVATGLLLRVQTLESDEFDKRDPVRVEVASVRRGSRGMRQWHVTCVPIGQRIYRINLPSQFTGLTSRETLPSWQQYSEWIAEAPTRQDVEITSDAEPLGRRIIHAAERAKAQPANPACWLVARAVLRQMQSSDETPLLQVLCALKVITHRYLAGNVDKRETLEELLVAIDVAGRQAVRSLHVELLHDAVQSDGIHLSAEAQETWRKIREIISRPIGEEQMTRLNSSLGFALVAGDESSRMVSFAVNLALGRLTTTGTRLPRAELLSRIVGWRRLFECWRQTTEESILPPRAARWLSAELEEAILKVRNRALDIAVLPPAPKLELEGMVGENAGRN